MDLFMKWIIVAIIVIGIGLFMFTGFKTNQKLDALYPKVCCQTFEYNGTGECCETYAFTKGKCEVGKNKTIGKRIVDEMFCYYYED